MTSGTGVYAAQPTWLQAQHITVSRRPLTLDNHENCGLYSLAPPAANVAVHTLSGSQKTLSSGVLQLAPSSSIVLGPDCRDAHFENLKLQGKYLFFSQAICIVCIVSSVLLLAYPPGSPCAMFSTVLEQLLTTCDGNARRAECHENR